MPASAQLPVVTGPATRVGPGLYRKRILSYGTIPYQGRSLTYDRPYAERLAASFQAGAYAQVPFLLGGPGDPHSNDPRRYTGQVRALEATGDGLDAMVELTAEGAEVVDRNPHLGVSPRIVESGEHVSHLPAVQHVAATFEPRGRNLGDWARVADLAAELGGVYDDATVDLTAAAMAPRDTTPTQLSATELARLAAVDPARVRALLDDTPADGDESPVLSPSVEPSRRSLLDLLRGTPAATAADDTAADDTAAGDGEGDDADVDRLLREVLAAETADDTREPAALSAADRRTVDLAAARAETAEARTDTLTATMAADLVARETVERVRQGVPKAIVDLAAPFLADTTIIELSGGGTLSPATAMAQILDECAGMVDLSGPDGSIVDPDEHTAAQTEARNIAEAAAKDWA